MEDIEKKESKRFFPGDSSNVGPLMRDVFVIPTSSRKKPKLTKIDELLLSLNPTQIEEGGFFVIIGRKSI